MINSINNKESKIDKPEQYCMKSENVTEKIVYHLKNY